MRLAMAVALVVGVVFLNGCGSPRPITYYGIQIPAAPAPASYTYPIEIVVGRVSGPDLLESSPIVYKTGRNVIGTYQYHRWTEAPVDLIQDKLARMLRVSGQFQSVTTQAAGSAGELMIRGRLYEFSEVDGDAITGLVSMEFELYNRKTAKILWSHFYSQTEPVGAKQVPAVAQALDRNLDRGLQEVLAGLRTYLASNPPVETRAPSARGLNEAKAK